MGEDGSIKMVTRVRGVMGVLGGVVSCTEIEQVD